MPTKEADLSPRRIQVLQRAADGLSYKDIAQELGIGEGGVKQMAVKILDALGADTMTQAVAMAIRRKIIE